MVCLSLNLKITGGFLTEIIKSTDFLPKQQPEVSSCWLHISYFLQKCKKGKSHQMDLPYWKNDITRFFIEMKRVF